MVKLNKIYTRTGDDGSTGLVGGQRISKSSSRIAAIGDIDETNCHIGIALAFLETMPPHLGKNDISPVLSHIQNDLFDLGADLATPRGTDDGEPLRLSSRQTAWMETQIDRLNRPLEPLNSFLLPGGTPAAAALHVARASARRAERSVIRLVEENPPDEINPHTRIYINRLSDLLFVAARFLNRYSQSDILWRPGVHR